MAGNEDKIRKDIADNLKDIVGDKSSADIASKVEMPKNGGEIHVTAKVPVNTEQQQQSAPVASQSANDDYEYDLSVDSYLPSLMTIMNSDKAAIPVVEESSDYKEFDSDLQSIIDSTNIRYVKISRLAKSTVSNANYEDDSDVRTKNACIAEVESSEAFRKDKYIGNAAKNISDDEIQGIDYRPITDNAFILKKGLPLGHVDYSEEDKLLSPEQRKDLAKRQLAFRRMNNGLNLDGSITDKQMYHDFNDTIDRSLAQTHKHIIDAATQMGLANKNIPHASNANNNAGTDASNAPQANPMVNAGGAGAVGGAANKGAGDNASMPTNGSSVQGDDQSPEQLADQLFNNQQSDFDAQKAAARDKLANDHNGSKFNSAIDNASNAVNDKMTGIANGINNRMQANNGGIFKDNGNLLNKVGNGLWKHGGSNLTAKGLNAVNKGLQGSLRGIQSINQNIAKNAQKLISIVTNPLLWYSIIAVVVIIALFTMVLTYGNGSITCSNQDTNNSGNSGDQIASWAEKIAADDSHGYSQANRNGNPDYDCSSLVYYAVTQGAGIQLSINYPFSTYNEREVLQAAGFTGNAWDGNDTSVLKRGDIVWQDGHTEIYSGNGKFTGAHINEKNGTGRPPDPESTPGDQTGYEISTENVIPPKMTYYLRSPGKSTSDSGTVSGGASDKTDFKSENAKQIFEYLTNEMGFSGAGAAGALANSRRESGPRFDPKAQNTRGGVAGIFQWSGFSNTVNGSRIIQEGSIKAGDTSTLTMENELKLTGFELNGALHKVKTNVGNASDPVEAAKYWSSVFEGVDLSDGQTDLKDLIQWANEACDAYNCKGISAQPDKLNQGGNGIFDAVNISNTKNASTEVQCMMTKNANTGSTGDFPSGQGDYSWMCNDERIKVCKNGDYGPVPPAAGYQCVWYAWTRLYMIHGINETYRGNGGEIGRDATKYGWTNPDTPAAGDGLSYFGGNAPKESGFHTDPDAGHVMVVEKVEDDPSGWKITLSEGNYACSSSGCWNGYHGGRTITKSQLELAVHQYGLQYWFFHNPKWDSNK